MGSESLNSLSDCLMILTDAQPRTMKCMRAGLGYRVIGMWEVGLSRNAIADFLGVPRATVGFWVRKFRKYGSLDRLSVSGRPRSTSARADRRLIRLCKSNRFSTSTELLHGWNESVCKQTVRNRLKQHHFKSCRPVVRPLLSPCHKSARLAWAMARCHFREQQWSRIVFTDESRFLLRPVDGRVRVWRMPCERFQNQCSVQKTMHGGGSVHVWGAICRTGRSELVILRSNVDGSTYKRILEDHLLPWAVRTLGAASDCWMLQDDNAPPHRARCVADFKATSGIRSIPWPSRSPDLNPIEHVWDMLGRKMRSDPMQPASLSALADRLKKAWSEINQEHVAHLIDSMSNRVRAVIDAQGGQTKY